LSQLTQHIIQDPNQPHLYHGKDGLVYVSFGPSESVMKLDLLLPEALRGMAYEEVKTSSKIVQYFELANLVLISSEAMAAHIKATDMTGASEANPAKVQLPFADLDHLRLRDEQGSLRPKQTEAVFSIVQAYWQESGGIGLRPGLVATLWREGRSAEEIIRFLRSATGSDGKINMPDQQHQTPVMQLIIRLSVPQGKSLVDPKRCEQVLQWLRSCRIGDPSFDQPDGLRADLIHLGVCDTQERPVDSATNAAKAFLDEHWQEEPNYPRLWRHVQSALGAVPAETADADYAAYNERLADLIDGDAQNDEIATAVLAMVAEGLDVPTIPLCLAARLQTIRQLMPATSRDMTSATYNDMALNWYAPDAALQTMRQLFQDQRYGLSESEFDAWLQGQGQPGVLRQITASFGQRSKWQTLRDLGLLDESGQWSEQGFLRQQAMVRQLTEEGGDLGLERLRWALHRTHHPDAPVRLAWALLNDLLPAQTLRHAKRMASIALSGGVLGDKVTVGDTITPEQYGVLRKVGAWICDDPGIYAKSDDLRWLGRLARNPNWENWTQICSFVSDKLDQEPEPDLLYDWIDGLVTFEGLGRFQDASAKPFIGAKIGRNDPCPCGSGKKYKKCCGR
jgi:hypothetical protein